MTASGANGPQIIYSHNMRPTQLMPSRPTFDVYIVVFIPGSEVIPGEFPPIQQVVHRLMKGVILSTKYTRMAVR